VGASVATIDWNPHIVADADDRFHFDRLPGETHSVVWQLDSNDSYSSHLITPVATRAGETATVAINAGSRAVSGRLSMPDGTPSDANTTSATLTRIDAAAAVDQNAPHVAFDPTNYWKADAPTFKLSVFTSPHSFHVTAPPGRYLLNVVAAEKTVGS